MIIVGIPVIDYQTCITLSVCMYIRLCIYRHTLGLEVKCIIDKHLVFKQQSLKMILALEILMVHFTHQMSIYSKSSVLIKTLF